MLKILDIMSLYLYFLSMDLDEQILYTRSARRRRTRIWLIVEVPLFVGYALAAGAAVAGRDTPASVVFLVLGAGGAAKPLVLEGHDERQRYRALLSFAGAAALGVLSLVAQVIRTHFDGAFQPRPQSVLLLVGASWVLINMTMAWWAGRQASREE